MRLPFLSTSGMPQPSDILHNGNCDPCLCRTVINLAKIKRGTNQPSTCPFSCGRHPYLTCFDVMRLSIFCLCANFILVAHAQFVRWRNFGQVSTFISWYCPFALQWLLKRGKSSKMQWPMWLSKQLFTTSSFVLECCFSLHNTDLQTTLTLL